MSRQVTQWLLFAALFCTVPVVYFMFVIAGLLPLVAILRLCFSGTWGFIIFNLVHLVIYGPMLFLAARYLTHLVFRLAPPARLAAIAVILALAVAVSLQPLYGVGHGDYAPRTLYRLFEPGYLG